MDPWGFLTIVAILLSPIALWRVSVIEKTVQQHLRQHSAADEKEALRLRVAAATLDSLKGVRFGIVEINLGPVQDRRAFIEYIITQDQLYPPVDLNVTWKSMQQLRIAEEHTRETLQRPYTVAVQYPAHVTLAKGMDVPGPYLKVIAGNVQELVPTELDLSPKFPPPAA